MRDKQIIDGVDVSGCEKQGELVAGITCGIGERIRLANEIITKHKLCKDNPNCIYKQLKRKEQECERLKWYLNEIRDEELKALDIELDEYETHCIDTEYTNIINLVEEALEERSPEDCRYKKDK